MMKIIQVMMVIFINVLTYKQIYAKQKTQNKLQQCENYQMSEKLLQETSVKNKIESYSYLKWTKKCNFHFVSIRNINLITSLPSSLRGA